jgi:ABC-2 type transport system permease protein
MNIFKHEIKQNRGATIIWTIALVAIAAMYISIYPTIFQTAEIAKVFDAFPEVYKKALGISDISLFTFAGLYGILLTFVILTGAVQAMNLGVGIVSKEVRNKTADFLLSKPVTRISILNQKLFSAVTLLLLTNIVFLAAAWGLIQAFIDVPFKFDVFIRSSLVLFWVQSFFFSIGFLLGVILPKIKSVIAVSLPVVFGFYILGLLDTVVGEEKIRYMTPFKFFDVSKLTSGGTYRTASLVYLGILVVLAIAGSYIVYKKKDIQAI